MKTCHQCQSSFKVTDIDRQFYQKVAPVFGGKKYPIPEPDQCPPCREQNRMGWKNERHLYKRICDLCQKDMLSIYSPGKPSTVYCLTCYWSDDWDPMEYGMEFDFDRPFFEQFKAFTSKIPKQTLHHNNNAENCDYTNATTRNRNCYLISSSGYNEDCYYGIFMARNKNCVDNTHIVESELCYECVDSDKGYQLAWCQNTKDCNNSRFLYDCHGSRDCFFSFGLRNKQYVFRNQQFSKEGYEKRLAEVDFQSHQVIENLKTEFQEAIKVHPRLYFDGQNNENVVASNGVFNSKNCSYCFDCNKLEDCHYCGWLNNSKDCQDVYAFGYGNELCFNSMQIGEKAVNILCSLTCWEGTSNLIYCKDSHVSQNLFACEGLRRKEYCIFNRQYSKEDYEILAGKILYHMQKTGEWGKFFPLADSDFAYNETVAHDFYPLKKEEALANGWPWREKLDDIPQVEKIISADQLPDRTADIPDDIVSWAIECKETNRPFRILAQELKFYREQNIPVPHLHPELRYRNRFHLRNPRYVFSRKCDQCDVEIKTTYSPGRPEKVYCEQCYLELVY